jgi:hypothetical protein
MTSSTSLELLHLRREVKTALELAIVALAPISLVDRLACSAGLLEAAGEMPPDLAPLTGLVSRAVSSAGSSLDDWRKWQKQHEGVA